MSFKDLFNSNQKDEDIHKKVDNLEKKFKRLNTIEVQINRLLRFEEQYKLATYNNRDKKHTDRKQESILPKKPDINFEKLEEKLEKK
ncbi:hypothetical protein [Metabacillus litoralis]|uniref:hypothetical protein n=1 Tax=Metabacillus litoralis TaxID=152268 RepID=UPI001CFE3D2A|nr:hypothetical protein [Metabacillus litoralis]